MHLEEGALLHSLAMSAATYWPGCWAVELGTHKGKSAIAIAAGAAAVGTKLRTHDVFLWQGKDIEAEARRNIQAARLDDACEILRLDSALAAGAWPVERSIGLLFIDGDHEHGQPQKDYQTWSPLVCPKGYIAFHDIDRADVKHAMDQAKKDGWLEFGRLLGLAVFHREYDERFARGKPD